MPIKIIILFLILFKLNCSFSIITDLKDQYWEAAEKLQRDNNYPYEMMPLLYAIVKSTQGNTSESQKLIHEGRWNLRCHILNKHQYV